MLRSIWSLEIAVDIGGRALENKSLSNVLIDWGRYGILEKGVGDMDHREWTL